MSRFLLGIDPSLNSLGFAVIDTKYKQPRVAEIGHVTGRTSLKSSGISIEVKLALIQAKILELKAKYHPLYPVVTIEDGFAKFKKETQALYRVRGVVEAALLGYTIDALAPTTVKKVVAGSGTASKEAVDSQLRQLFGDIPFAVDDESDALAVAYCGYLKRIGDDV